ncbi:MAG: ABC transporter permease [Bacteroidota bacterium]|nr:ABC transporter permease [Bacteroidota bacterium]
MLFRRKRKEYSSSPLSRLAIKRLLRNSSALASMGIIAVATLIAILGYLITPDSTPDVNQQYLELATRKPGFKANMLKLRNNAPPKEHNLFYRMLFGAPSNYEEIPYSSYKIDGAFLTITEYTDIKNDIPIQKQFHLADIAFALATDATGKIQVSRIGDQITYKLYDGTMHTIGLKELRQKVIDENLTVRRFPLGTDRYGRDMLSQLMIGTRVSLSVGFIAIAISLLIGITLGAIAGYFGGKIDQMIVWLINVVWSVPTLLLVIAITFVLGKGFWQVFIAVGLTMWVEVARVVRGQVLSIREKEFIEAARALGYRNRRIIFRHILPNVMGPVIVISAANFASAILLEAGLSFLGIGVQPPTPSWGSMIKENYGYIILDYAYLAIMTGVAIMLMVLAFMLLGNALRDALDVKTVASEH